MFSLVIILSVVASSIDFVPCTTTGVAILGSCILLMTCFLDVKRDIVVNKGAWDLFLWFGVLLMLAWTICLVPIIGLRVHSCQEEMKRSMKMRDLSRGYTSESSKHIQIDFNTKMQPPGNASHERPEMLHCVANIILVQLKILWSDGAVL